MFAFLGPFVVILTKIINDIVKIAFVFVVFYIPTVATFYQFYCDPDNEGFKDLRQTLFTVYRYCFSPSFRHFPWVTGTGHPART